MRPHRQQLTRLPRPWDSPGNNTGVGCHFLLQCMKVKSESEVVQLCPTLSDPMDFSLPGSSVHGSFQARVLEWVATAFSRKQPTCPLTGEWIKKMWYVYTHTQKHIYNEVLLSYKKNEILPFVITWMELWRYCAKWNKSDREKRNTVQFHLYVNSKQTNEPPSSDTQNILMVARGGGWGKRVMGVKRCKSLSYAVNKSWGCNIQHGDYSQ